jgi:predicted nuclease with TOPRIM domain
MVDQASSWPAVVAGALDKVPIESFGAAFWVLLGVVVVVGLPFLRKILAPAQSGAELEAAVARGVSKVVNGDLKEIRAQLNEVQKQMGKLDNHVGNLEQSVEKNRKSAKEWHEENSERLDKYDRVLNRLKPWDGFSERRGR